MSFHLYRIDEIYSSADGSVQFVELRVGGSNGESFWAGQRLTASSGGVTHSFTFPSNLPSTQTANTTVLVATQGFADLGLVRPDYIVPNGFLFTSNATLSFAGVSVVNYASLPSDPTQSIDAAGTAQTNSPTNFAGASASLTGPVTIAGGSGADTLTGGAGAETLRGLAGNDRLDGGGGDDTLDGGDGLDTAVYPGARSAYAVADRGAGVDGAQGHDTLTGIERLRFADLSVAFDLDGAAGTTVKLLGALFGPEAAANRAYCGIGIGLLDGGMSRETLAREAIRARLGDTPSNLDLVRVLYTDLVGSAPDDATAASFAGQIDNGTYTQVSLTLAAAEHELNAGRIGLTGLVLHGVEFTPG